MTPRERVKTALQFERPDRLPRNESPWKQTVERWQREGLPDDVSLTDYFDFDITCMFIDPSPQFPMRILSQDEECITYDDRYGYRIRKDPHGESTIEFLRHVTKDRDTWEEEVKPRLVLSSDPTAPARLDDQSYFGHFDPFPTWGEAIEKYERLYASDRYMLFMFYGPWEAAWRHRGMEALLMDFALTPDWIEEMAQVHVDLLMAVMERCIALGAKPDGIWWAEDLGANSGPLFSPKSWDTLLGLHYARFGDFLRHHGIDFWMHSDGRIHSYLERLIDVGVQCLNPLQVQAGMDAVALRREFGDRLAFYGGISAQAMAGPRVELGAVLERIIPIARDGGYIMHSDHSVPPDVSFEQFCWLQKRAEEIFAAVDWDAVDWDDLTGSQLTGMSDR